MADAPTPRRPSAREASWRPGDITIIVLVAAVVRWPAVVADFWFDEILSYENFARRASSMADIFFAPALKHDNNHQLNTLVLYWLGDQSWWPVYRLPALACGLLTVGAVVVLGQRRGRLEGLATGLLVAASFMFIVYSTEARGYSWALCFAVLGFLALDTYLASGSRRARALFWAAVGVGLAAHPAILHFYLGAVLWSGYRLRSARPTLVRLHALPLAWILAWLLVVVRGAGVGGGPAWTWHEIADRSLSWTLGYSTGIVPAAIAATGVAVLVAWDARRLWLEGSDQGLFYVGAIAGPVVLLAALSPPFLFPRYLLVPLLFLLAVTGRALARLWTESTVGPPIAVALLVGFLWGNGMHLVRLVEQRHGNHEDAVRLLAGAGVKTPVAVTSRSLDAWTELPLQFYARTLGLTGRIEYVPRGRRRTMPVDARPIEWLVEPSEPCAALPGPRLRLPSGDVYVLTSAFPVCGPSGMSWSLYAIER
jgi:hypothetical protein